MELMMTQKTSLPDQILNQNRNQNQNAFTKLNQFYYKIFGLLYHPLLAVSFLAKLGGEVNTEEPESEFVVASEFGLFCC